jgi:tRNA threonylcarbamoyladenosine biosynthesis protein TsaB
MRILALETATNTVGLALMDECKVLGELTLDLGRHHAEVLLPALDKLFAMTGLKPEEMDLLACTIGPGSFTGLRIGISTVKGLALAIDKPIVGVSTLEALALNAIPAAGWICPMFDARKSQVYTGLYRIGPDGLPASAGEERLIGIGDFLQGLPGEEILFLGDGAVAHAGLIDEIMGKRAVVCSSSKNRILASSVGLIGRKRYQNGLCLDMLTFAPRYLRPSTAEDKHKTDASGKPNGSAKG